MKDKDLLQEILAETAVDEQEYWMNSCSTEESVPMSMLFLREAWSGVMKAKQTEWIPRLIESLQERIGREDLYALRFLPEKPDLLAALQQVQENNTDLQALSYIVRESQKGMLYWLMQLLDGGFCFDDGLESNWQLFEIDDNGKPLRPFMMLQDVASEFDPEKSDDA
jgi:hypothetical protein